MMIIITMRVVVLPLPIRLAYHTEHSIGERGKARPTTGNVAVASYWKTPIVLQYGSFSRRQAWQSEKKTGGRALGTFLFQRRRLRSLGAVATFRLRFTDPKCASTQL